MLPQTESLLAPWLRSLADLFFPPQCLGCGAAIDSSQAPRLCAVCLESVRAIASSPCCEVCGFLLERNNGGECPDCLRLSFSFDRARALFEYAEPVASCILALKFQGRLEALSTLAALAQQAQIMRQFRIPDFILPVPLHPSRLRERGFNQALLIARCCFPLWRAKIATHILQRNRATIAQTNLSGAERRRNVQTAFSVAHQQELIGKSLLLVDDVFTTGATAHECGKILRQAGAARIEVFTLARSLPRREGHKRVPRADP